jgi:hypothetical protein
MDDHDVVTERQRPSVDTSNPAICGRFKTGHYPVTARDGIKVYLTLSPGGKSPCSFVRQLRGPHFSTCPW